MSLRFFWEYGIKRNQWLWSHLILAVLLSWAVAHIILFFNPLQENFREISFVIVLAVAVVFEKLQELIECPDDLAKKSIYGGWDQWVADTMGDILGAVVASAMFLFLRI
jgi:hypothetical protein